MTKEKFEELRSKQDLSDLHYPAAKEGVWKYYGVFLGKFTDSKGKNYDLGFHFQEYPNSVYRFSNCTVFSNNSGSVLSGEMDYNQMFKYDRQLNTKLHWYQQWGFESEVECWNRLQALLKNIE